MRLRSTARRVVLETVGWLLVLAGIAALVLPGPGLVLLAAGLVLLAEQYPWAERRLEPVRAAALRAAREGVATWPRLLLSLSGAAALVALGALWAASPPAPEWWPIHERYWLAGGWGTAATLFLSGACAVGLLAWSWRRFRG
ncbi:MAG: PGPGW domain-containing protein [Marmoricola sp.]